MVDHHAIATGNPRVTFALFSYNQERYIRQAVEGAFAQTYQPLEILLSDDCSTDSTFSIMKQMAKEYRGPHNVRVVQNEQNLGVLPHIISRGREASGDIVICAAGDDVSLPNRTECLVNRYGPDTGAVYSMVSIVDEIGNVVSPLAERPLHMAAPTVFLRQSNNEHVIVQGCSASYRRWVFDVPIDPDGKGYAEDPLFSLYLNLKGAKIERVNSPLVLYRRHAMALSNTTIRKISTEDQELKIRADAQSALQWIADVERLAAETGGQDQLDLRALRQRQSEASEIVTWSALSMASRLRRVFRSSHSDGGPPLKWKLVRLFGRCPHYQPKILLERFRNSL